MRKPPIDWIRIEVRQSDIPEIETRTLLMVRTMYQGREYGAQVPLDNNFLESDFDRYMDASLHHLKEVLRRALNGETIG